MPLWYVEAFERGRLCSFMQVLEEWVRLPLALPWHATARCILPSVVLRRGPFSRRDSHR